MFLLYTISKSNFAFPCAEYSKKKIEYKSKIWRVFNVLHIERVFIHCSALGDGVNHQCQSQTVVPVNGQQVSLSPCEWDERAISSNYEDVSGGGNRYTGLSMGGK